MLFEMKGQRSRIFSKKRNCGEGFFTRRGLVKGTGDGGRETGVGFTRWGS